jgi:hypothetical protein
MTYGEYKGKKYDGRHGGPFDRGSADSWYGRPVNPHYFKGDTHTSEEVTELTAEEVEAYLAGYEYNEECGGKKEYD